MAECVAARCVQERRFFKRELQKWGKNVLYLVGLERVAEEVVGHKKWRKLTRPLGDGDLQVPEAVDWSPEEKCYFCTNRKNSSSANRSKTSSHSANNNNGTIDDDDDAADQDSREGSPCSVASDQPLDLSMGNKARSHSPVSYNGDVNGTTFLKVPRMPDKSSRKLKRRSDTVATNSVNAAASSSSGISASSTKRSYTDDELQAALRDIRSGKLGTRRAAVIYGIPRSTLRNKVYKMSLDKVALDVSSSSKSKDTTEGVRPLTMEELVAGSDDGISASESLKRLLRNRMAERLETKKAASSVSQALSSLESNSALTPFLSHVLSNIQHLALSHQGGSDGGREATNELKLPLLPDLIRKLSEERFEEECNRVHHRGGGLHSTESVILKIPSYKPVKTRSNNNNNNGGGCEATASSQSGGVIGGDSNVGNGAKGGVMLREIVAKSVSQQTANSSRKIPVKSTSVTNGSEASLSLKSFTKERISSSSASKRKPTTMSSDNRCSSSSSSSKMPRVNDDEDDDEETNKSEKRMRPKRGRYRNYDRDNLVEAVRAVQRGEMSVHRAGSYYGVPHSTLEYKVKERHLLRPKKRRSGQSEKHRHKKGGLPSVASSKSSFVASSGSNSCSNSSNDGSSHDSMPTSTEKGLEDQSVKESGSRADGLIASQTTTNTTPSTSSLWPFSLDLGRLNSSNFFASQMMRKLQEDALMQSKHDVDNGINDRDALLLGVLIRNGLQIKPTETASTK